MAKINIEQYKAGMIVNAVSARVEEKKTKAPLYYTEASLLDDMVAAHKFATNEEDRKMLQLTKGIGTARTRGEVIKELLRGKYMISSRSGKDRILKDTPAGRQLSALAPAALKSVTMTAKWEILFSKIESGELLPSQFRQVIRKFVAALVESVRQQKENGGIVWNHAERTKTK